MVIHNTVRRITVGTDVETNEGSTTEVETNEGSTTEVETNESNTFRISSCEWVRPAVASFVAHEHLFRPNPNSEPIAQRT